MPHNTIGHTHAKILVNALERQVSRGDTYGELIILETKHTPEHRVSDTIMHVTLLYHNQCLLFQTHVFLVSVLESASNNIR